MWLDGFGQLSQRNRLEVAKVSSIGRLSCCRMTTQSLTKEPVALRLGG